MVTPWYSLETVLMPLVFFLKFRYLFLMLPSNPFDIIIERLYILLDLI